MIFIPISPASFTEYLILCKELGQISPHRIIYSSWEIYDTWIMTLIGEESEPFIK